MPISKIYKPGQVRFTPSNAEKSRHLGMFQFDACTLALKCKGKTNNVGVCFKRNGVSQPVTFVDHFKRRMTPTQLKQHLNSLPEYAIKVEKEGRHYTVSMQHVQRLKGGTPSWLKHLGHQDDEKHVQHERRKSLSKTALPHNFTIKQLKSTRQLAVGLSLSRPGSDDYLDYETMCFNILDKYATSTVPHPLVHQEISGLSQSKHAKIIEKTLNVLLLKLKENPLLDTDVVLAIHDTLRYADPQCIRANHLVNVLDAFALQSKELHLQKSTVPQLHKLLKALGKTLDKMADCKVDKIKFEQHWKPLLEALEALEKHEDWTISSQASYALQSLLRLTNDQTATDKALIKVRHALSGIDDLITAVKDQQLTPLVDALLEFKDALKHEKEKKKWYDNARLLNLLLQEKKWTELRDQLKGNIDGLEAKEKHHLVLFLLDHLIEIAAEHENDPTRAIAIELIQKFLIEDPQWGSKGFKEFKEKMPLIKFALIQELLELAKLHNPSVGNQATHALELIGIIAQKKVQEKNTEYKELLLKAGLWHLTTQDGHEVLDPIIKIEKNTTADPATPKASTTLFDEVKETLLNLDSFLKNKAKDFTKLDVLDKDADYSDKLELKYLLETYYAPSYDPIELDADKKELSLMERIQSFMKSAKKVLLIKANPGGGKTSFAKKLEYDMWKALEINPKAPIPVLISAAKLHENSNEAVEEALKEKGFVNDQIKKIISEKREILVIFDGYEEMPTKKKMNLHSRHNIDKFNAKTIVTCRTQAPCLTEESEYWLLFAAKMANKHDRSSLDEISLKEFAAEDRKKFLKQFTKEYDLAPCKEDDFKDWNAEKYLSIIDKLPGLGNLLSNPYLLFITACVLPKIMKDNPKLAASGGIRNLLVKEYFDQWFDRERRRSVDREDENEGTMPFAKRCYIYTKNLVAKWYNMDESVIEHTDDDEQDEGATWFREFSKEQKIWRTACPLMRVGKHSWNMNPLLKEFMVFFQMRDALVEKSSTKKKQLFGDDNFTKKEITNESIIQFFVDELRTNHTLEAILRKYLQESPSSIAGINSDKILKAYDKAMKDESKS